MTHIMKYIMKYIIALMSKHMVQIATHIFMDLVRSQVSTPLGGVSKHRVFCYVGDELM